MRPWLGVLIVACVWAVFGPLPLSFDYPPPRRAVAGIIAAVLFLVLVASEVEP